MGVGNEIAVDSRLDQQPTKHWTWCSVGSGVHTDSQASQSETCCQASVIVNARGNTLVLVAKPQKREQGTPGQSDPGRTVESTVEPVARLGVPARTFVACINQDIRIDEDHLNPSPSA